LEQPHGSPSLYRSRKLLLQPVVCWYVLRRSWSVSRISQER